MIMTRHRLLLLAAALSSLASASVLGREAIPTERIMAPGEDEVAMFNGSVAENQYEGLPPATGDYKVSVYLMRSAARRNEVANYRLELIVTDAREVPDAPMP